MLADKISIIVPVYNVEPYLDRCVQSVLQQSYQNIEVLLVDDGSPDNSGTMCDRWAEKDGRIRVIHKKNGGLSDARNKGLDFAAGEYIAFVDSDDCIAADMVQTLYQALKANDADISICNYILTDEDCVPLKRVNDHPPIEDEVLSGLDAIRKMADNNGRYFLPAWNKLYKKSLFSEIRFPKGKLYEDSFIVHKLYERCNRVACVSYAGYYYVQRSGGIMASRSCKLFLHATEAFMDQAISCVRLGLCKSASQIYWRAAMQLQDAYARRESAPELTAELEDAVQLFRRYFYLRKACPLKKRLQIDLIYLHPQLYFDIFRSPVRQSLKTAFHNQK